jgi:hypothetical protein
MRNLLLHAIVFGAVGAACIQPSAAQNTADTIRFNIEKAACLNQGYKTTTQIEICQIAAEQRWLNGFNFPWMDLAYRNESEHLAITEAFDAGRISRARAELELSASDERMAIQTSQRTQAYSAALAARAGADSLAQLRQMQINADRDIALMRFAGALGQPTRSGSFAESLGNAMTAYGGGVQSAPRTYAPAPASPTQTTCRMMPNGMYSQVICTSQ